MDGFEWFPRVGIHTHGVCMVTVWYILAQIRVWWVGRSFTNVCSLSTWRMDFKLDLWFKFHEVWSISEWAWHCWWPQRLLDQLLDAWQPPPLQRQCNPRSSRRQRLSHLMSNPTCNSGYSGGLTLCSGAAVRVHLISWKGVKETKKMRSRYRIYQPGSNTQTEPSSCYLGRWVLHWAKQWAGGILSEVGGGESNR